MTASSPSRVRRAILCSLATALFVLAGCSSGEGDAALGRAGATTTTLPAQFPLTGRPVTDPDKLNRPALSVKIDNISAARPQAGIDAADVVYEEFTEGITRFVVVFHSSDAGTVGPVRSVRPADPVIVTPLGGVFAFSGGSPPIVQLAEQAPVDIVTENDTDVLRRRSGRSAPHNLYTSTEGLFSKASAGTGPPPAFASFLREGQGFAAGGATPATGVSVAAAPDVTADYTWDPASGTWPRTTDGRAHALEGGGQIAPTTVIVQFTPYTTFAADAQVRYPEVVGTGEAWIFAAGALVRGSWSKGSAADVAAFTDAAGAPVVLPPGQTWVHLVVPGSAVLPR